MDPSHARPRRGTFGRRLLLAFAMVLAALGAVEGSLWLVAPLPAPAVHRVHRFLPSWNAIGPMPQTIRFDPGPLPGVTPGVVEIAYNAYGFLYPEARHARASADELRIAVVGGSTVECSALAAERRWSAVLEADLRAALPGRPVTVLNLGVSAQDTRTHVATAAQFLPGLGVDLCVFMIGTNDLGLTTSDGPRLLTPDSFLPGPRLSQWWKDFSRRTQIGRHLNRARHAVVGSPSEPYYARDARRQASLPPIDTPIDVTEAGLRHYAQNVQTLAGVCKEHGIAVLFATQPWMFPAAPSAEELRAYWGCHTGSRSIPAANFVAVLGKVNAHLLATCAQHGYACVDLEPQVPKGFASFYDQVHFNEAGARRVAEVLTDPVLRLVR